MSAGISKIKKIKIKKNGKWKMKIQKFLKKNHQNKFKKGRNHNTMLRKHGSSRHLKRKLEKEKKKKKEKMSAGIRKWKKKKKKKKLKKLKNSKILLKKKIIKMKESQYPVENLARPGIWRQLGNEWKRKERRKKRSSEEIWGKKKKKKNGLEKMRENPDRLSFSPPPLQHGKKRMRHVWWWHF